MPSRLLERQAGVLPPLGLAYIASVLEIAGHDVKILDEQVNPTTREQLAQIVTSYRPDVVGVSCMTVSMPYAFENAAIIKDACPDALVVFGGPHPTALPAETLANPNVDVVAMGEGKFLMRDLCAALESGRDLSSVDGIVYKKNGQVYSTPRRPLIADLDSIPFPARHLLPTEKYQLDTSMRAPVTSMTATRGMSLSLQVLCVSFDTWKKIPEKVD